MAVVTSPSWNERLNALKEQQEASLGGFFSLDRTEFNPQDRQASTCSSYSPVEYRLLNIPHRYTEEHLTTAKKTLIAALALFKTDEETTEEQLRICESEIERAHTRLFIIQTDLLKNQRKNKENSDSLNEMQKTVYKTLNEIKGLLQKR